MSPRTRKAIIHEYLVKRARKAARTRKKQGKKPKEKPPVEAAAAVNELVLYEADEDQAAVAFSAWEEWPVRASEWRVQVVLLSEGEVVATETLHVAPAWDTEPSPGAVRREVRAWYDTWRADHPGAGSPQAGVYRLSLVLLEAAA